MRLAHPSKTRRTFAASAMVASSMLLTLRQCSHIARARPHNRRSVWARWRALSQRLRSSALCGRACAVTFQR